VGVQLTYEERDRLRREVSSKLAQIEPRLDPSRYRLELHQVLDERGRKLNDLCVIEMVVPATDSTEPYYTGGGEVWVKSDGVKQKVKGTALTDFVKQRLSRVAVRNF
jgi:hypothetical protein